MRKSLRWWWLPVVAVLLPALGWSLRSYDREADPEARMVVERVELRRDLSYHWLELDLRHRGPLPHDRGERVRLLVADGEALPPADIRLAEEGGKVRGLHLKFWLEPGQLDGPLELKVNRGRLRIRDGSSDPALEDGGRRSFSNYRW